VSISRVNLLARARESASKFLYFWCLQTNLYTDHGIEHAEHVANYVYRIIQVIGDNFNLEISSPEYQFLYIAAFFP